MQIYQNLLEQVFFFRICGFPLRNYDMKIMLFHKIVSLQEASVSEKLKFNKRIFCLTGEQMFTKIIL